MLITGQPDKMLRDLRNSKGSTELSATSMWIPVSGDNHNILNLVLSLNVRVLETSYKIQQGQYFIAPTADTFAEGTIT